MWPSKYRMYSGWKIVQSSIAILLVVGCLAFPKLVIADGVKPATFDLDLIYDAGSLEIQVIEDWHEAPKADDVLLKLIEITVCEWWPGQKVRLPVTLAVPKGQTPCRNIVVENMGLAPKVAMPSGGTLELLRKYQVGVVLAGMGTLDAMEPKGQLHLGMRENLLKTKDARFTPAWIWGMSDMRALTAAMTEIAMFQPEKVLATGGSKRGVGAAVSGIHDPRFTAIMPVVAPILDSPGGAYVRGSALLDIERLNDAFLNALAPGVNPLKLPDTARQAFVEREQRRLDQALTIEQAKAAGWSQAEMLQMNHAAWDACLIAKHMDTVRQRRLEFLYHVGTNDNVCPGLVELGKEHPDFPIYILPGGQHGGPNTNGYTLQTPTLAEVDENLVAFGVHHFYGKRSLPTTPRLTILPADDGKSLTIEVNSGADDLPEFNQLSWCKNRSPNYSFAAEFDAWNTIELTADEKGVFKANLVIPSGAERIDFVSTHRQIENGLPIHYSSAYTRWQKSDR